MTRITPIAKTTLIAVLAILGSPARADNLTWTGVMSDLWNTTDANWSGDDTVFANGDHVLFNATTGTITGIVSRSPGSTTVTSNNKITFATGIMGGNQAHRWSVQF